MIPLAQLEPDHLLLTTDGEITRINLESARRRSWSRFFAEPQRDGLAETVVAHEQLTAQFVGDVCALDRLESLTDYLVAVLPSSPRTALIQAQVASTAHRFADAKGYLAQAEINGAPRDDIRHLKLNIDQACGADLDGVLEQRRQITGNSGRLDDLIPLGALLTDMGEFDAADQAYTRGLREYCDVSPLSPAGACFQLGVLWGECVPKPDMARAADWYSRAISYFPSYAKARVHLAEIYLRSGRLNEASELLTPVVCVGDPEIWWRLAEVTAHQGKNSEAEAQLNSARVGFESLLERHLLAFADHAAEFYAGSGSDIRRALDLARLNVANRPTLRAFEQAHAIAVSAREADAAVQLLDHAFRQHGTSSAFRCSPLANLHSEAAT